jgi:hypothetical protein
VLTRRPICVTATEPEKMRKNSRPIRPSRARTSPSATWTPLRQPGHFLKLGAGAVPEEIDSLEPVDCCF